METSPSLNRAVTKKGQLAHAGDLNAWQRAVKGFARIFSNPLATAGMVITIIMVTLSFSAPLIAPYDPLNQDISNRVADPSMAHWFGTDEFGRDILSRVLHGGNTSLRIASVVMLVSMLSGTALGLITGFFGKLTDTLIMRFVDVLMAFPGILLAIGIMAILGSNTINVVIALSIVYVPNFTRLVRGSVLSLKEMEYVHAATVVGARPIRILTRHLLPNCFAPILVQATISFVYAIRTEATLSFLGLGTPPPNPTWGNILRDSTGFLIDAPWMPFFPGLAIAFTILGLNLFGDGLRDILDPKLRQ